MSLNRAYFPNYCLIIKPSILFKVRNTGFCQFATVKKTSPQIEYRQNHKNMFFFLSDHRGDFVNAMLPRSPYHFPQFFWGLPVFLLFPEILRHPKWVSQFLHPTISIYVWIIYLVRAQYFPKN